MRGGPHGRWIFLRRYLLGRQTWIQLRMPSLADSPLQNPLPNARNLVGWVRGGPWPSWACGAPPRKSRFPEWARPDGQWQGFSRRFCPPLKFCVDGPL